MSVFVMPSGKEAMRLWRERNPEKDAANKERAKERQRIKRQEQAKLRPPRPKRLWQGSAPAESLDPVLICEVGGEWSLYEMKAKRFGSWRNYKLVSKIKRSGKANYLLSHNGERFASSADLKIILGNDRELLSLIDEAIKNDFTPTHPTTSP